VFCVVLRCCCFVSFVLFAVFNQNTEYTIYSKHGMVLVVYYAIFTAVAITVEVKKIELF